MAETRRRARGEDSIYSDRSRGCWTGTITVGWKADGRRDRITVCRRTKTEVTDKLRAKHTELAGHPLSGPLRRRALPGGLAGDPEHAVAEHRHGLPDYGQTPDRTDRQQSSSLTSR